MCVRFGGEGGRGAGWGWGDMDTNIKRLCGLWGNKE